LNEKPIKVRPAEPSQAKRTQERARYKNERKSSPAAKLTQYPASMRDQVHPFTPGIDRDLANPAEAAPRGHVLTAAMAN